MAENSTKIVLTAEDRTTPALQSVTRGLQGMQAQADLAGRALGALGVTFSAAAAVAFVKGTIDAADGMNDLSQKVGIGIRQLAGWTLAANQSGTSIESVARGIKGLSGYLIEHGDKMRAAGITATDANGAMIELADLFAAMPDGVQKTALAVQIFGKAGMEMIPMLNMGSKGLAEAQEKADEYGRKMAELAPEADKFNDLLSEMAINSKGLGMNITGHLLSPLTNLVTAMNELSIGGARAEKQMGWLADQGHPIAKAVMAWSGVFKSMGIGEMRSRGYTGQKDATGLPMSEAEQFDAATSAYVSQFDARRKGLGMLDKTGGGSGGGAEKYKRSFDPAADFEFAVDESMRKQARDRMVANDKEMAALDEKAKKMDETHMARMEASRIESEGEEAIRESMEKTSREMAKQKDMAQDLGLTFSSAFEDAVIGGRSLQSVLGGLAQDVARIFLRKTITEPMAAGLSGLFKDMDIGSWFGGARAGGGPVSSGSTYLVGENGPELFTPGASGSIIPNHALGGGGGVSVAVNIIGAPSQPQVQQRSDGNGGLTLDIIFERVDQFMAGNITSGRGATQQALGNTYGLNRAAGAY